MSISHFHRQGFSVLLIGMLACTGLVNAVVLNDSASAEQQKVFNLLPQLVEQPQLLEQKLIKLSKTEQIMTRAKAIKMMANGIPTPEQMNWMQAQTKSNDTLQQPNPDHPEQMLTIVNIANNAKATLYHWKVSERAATYQAQIKKGQWSWLDFDQQSHLQQNALNYAIKSLSPEHQVVLQESLIHQNFLAKSNNRTLATLIKRQPNTVLASELFSKKPDEFSYQQLAKVPDMYPEAEAVNILQKAVKNPSLISMSLMTLSRNYGDNTQARNILVNQLTNEKNTWLAAMAISQSTSEELRYQVKQLKQHKQQRSINQAISFTSQKLNENVQ